MAPRGRSTGAKASISRRGFFAKTGVTFPVRRVQRYLKSHHLINKKNRVSTNAALYLSAVLEYVSAEVLELAGMAAKHNNKRRISPRSIWLAIKSDDEFRQLMKGSIMPESGNLWGSALMPASASSSGTATSPNSRKLVSVQKAPKARAGRANPVPLASTSAAGTSGASLGGGVETLGRTLLSGVQLSVLKADITSVEADCYINPTGDSVGWGGQVGSRLAAVGGMAMQNALHDFMHQDIPNCGALTTPAGGLKAHHIIHCNSPSWSGANAIQRLETLVKNCLDEVCTHKFKTVAIPNVGSGGNGFPKQTAAQTILRTISDYFKHKPKAEFDTEKICFVLFDSQSVKVYQTELSRLVE